MDGVGRSGEGGRHGHYVGDRQGKDADTGERERNAPSPEREEAEAISR
jgi:hypothetical protein